jgi:NAD(P)H-dependent flavin oxidoreductase YrpB (nitropropane dioxygenase family)
MTHNGRAIVNATLTEHDSGTVTEKELQQKYDVAMTEGDYARLVVYAGTGIGLVTKEQSAAEILDEVEAQFAQQVRLVNQKLNSL